MRLGEKKVSGAYGNITERKGISLSLVWGLHWIFFFFLHDDGGFGNGDKPVEPRQWWRGGKPGDKPGSDLLSPTCHYRKWWSWLWWRWPLLCFRWTIPFSNNILLSSNFGTQIQGRSETLDLVLKRWPFGCGKPSSSPFLYFGHLETGQSGSEGSRRRRRARLSGRWVGAPGIILIMLTIWL